MGECLGGAYREMAEKGGLQYLRLKKIKRLIDPEKTEQHAAIFYGKILPVAGKLYPENIVRQVIENCVRRTAGTEQVISRGLWIQASISTA